MQSKLHLCLASMGGNEERYIHEAISSNWVTSLGPAVDAFEKDIEHWLSANGAETNFPTALSSGTSALHLALKLLDVGEGDEVLCQSWTFAASVNPVRYLGAKPVFVDSEKETWNIDPQLLEQAIKDREKATGKRPKAIIAVDLYGMPAKWDEIKEISERYAIPVLEDSAEAMGSLYRGRPCGTFGCFGVFSFNGNKMITTGAGGVLICHDRDTRNRVLYFATQARSPFPYYHHEEIGFNYRLSNISAAIGRGQMEVLDQHIAHHRAIHEAYCQFFCLVDGIEVKQNPSADFDSNFWLTTILIDKEKIGLSSELLRQHLERENIESRPLWKPMHLQPVFRDCSAFINGVSDEFWEKGLCLPSGPCISIDDAKHIAETIVKAIGQ